jgi:hypothetical protein
LLGDRIRTGMIVYPYFNTNNSEVITTSVDNANAVIVRQGKEMMSLGWDPGLGLLLWVVDTEVPQKAPEKGNL